MVCIDIPNPSPHVDEVLHEDRHHIPQFFILSPAVHVEDTPTAGTAFIHSFIHSFILHIDHESGAMLGAGDAKINKTHALSSVNPNGSGRYLNNL